MIHTLETVDALLYNRAGFDHKGVGCGAAVPHGGDEFDRIQPLAPVG